MIHALEIVWNFNPDLIKIGFFPIKYYSLMYVLSFILGLQVMSRIYKNEKIPSEKLDSLFIYTIVAMLIGARLGHFLFYDFKFLMEHPLEVILPFRFSPEFEYTGFQGLASHGAAIGIIIAMYFYSKKVVHKPLLWTLDRLVIPSALGAMFVRLGNLFNSEIVGKATGTDFGFKFIRNDIRASEAVNYTKTTDVNRAYDLIASKSEFASILAEVPNRYPTQLYEALGYLLTFIVLLFIYWKTDKKEKLGYLFGVFMVFLWTVRFVVEFFKKSQGGLEDSIEIGLNTGQLLSIPLILIGLFFMLKRAK